MLVVFKPTEQFFYHQDLLGKVEPTFMSVDFFTLRFSKSQYKHSGS